MTFTIAPALGYPVFAAAMFGWDLIVGDQLVMHHLRYDQRTLWGVFWSDYLNALPAFYVGAAALVLTWLLLKRYTGVRSPAWVLLLGAVGGWLTGSYLAGGWVGAGPLIFGATGAMLAALLLQFAPHELTNGA